MQVSARSMASLLAQIIGPAFYDGPLFGGGDPDVGGIFRRELSPDRASRVALNPQPLPPRAVDSSVRIAINPQPLPPRGSDTAMRNVSPKPYVGETEKN